MSVRLSYKSKRILIISLIAIILFAAAGIGTYFFVKGNNQAAATTENDASQTIANEEQMPDQNGEQNEDQTQNQEQTQENPESTPEEGTETEDIADTEGTTETTETTTGTAAGTTTSQTGNVPNQEYVTETIEEQERLVYDRREVGWSPIALASANTDATPEVAIPDLTLDKQVITTEGKEIDSVKTGEEFIYEIHVTNNSVESEAKNIHVSDAIPEGTELVEIRDNGWQEGNKLFWKIETVGKGETKVVSFKVKATATEGSISNTAVVEGKDTPTTETKVAHITAQKASLYTKPLQEKDEITYQITLTNSGTAAGTVTVTDTVPEGTTFVKDSILIDGKVSKDNTAYTSEDEKITWADVEVEPGETVVLSFKVTVDILEEGKDSVTIINADAKVDGTTPVDPTEDEAKKEYRDIDVTKIWDDNENTANKRPEAIEVVLKADGTELRRVTLNAENGWKTTFGHLPTYNMDGTEIAYTVEESIDSIFYNKGDNTPSITGDMVEGYTITNHFVVPDEKVTFEVVKDWQDNNNEAGKRPESITVTIEGNGEEYTQTITGPDWKYTFENLPKYDANGDEITYSVKEEVVNSIFYKQDGINTENGKATITNRFEVPDERISIPVEKVWEDNNNALNKRPESVTITLTGNGTEETKTLNEDNNWKDTFTNLAKYDAMGNVIDYTLTETVNGDNAKFYVQKGEITDVAGVKTFTNEFKVPDEKVTFEVIKDWQDNNNEAGKRPESITVTIEGNGEEYTHEVTGPDWKYTFENLPKYDANGDEITYSVKEEVVNSIFYKQDGINTENGKATITNRFEVPDEKVSVPVEKIWNDNNDEAEKRPDSVTITLKGSDGSEQKVDLNEQNNWKHTFEAAKYDTKGNIIAYTAEETINGDNANSYQGSMKATQEAIIFTNTFVPFDEKIDIPVEKVWQDGGNAAGKRPESITVVLKDEDGQVGEAKELNAGNDWKTTFEDVAKYDEYNNVISYTVEETVNGDNAKFYTQVGGMTIVDGVYTLTNKFEVPDEKITIPVEKTWNDNENAAGKRPTSIDVVVKGSDGSETPVTLEEGKDWKAQVSVAKYDTMGNEITYTVEEVTKNEFYDASVDGYKVTNNIVQDKVETDISVTKVWNDGDNKAGLRPGEIEVAIKNGTEEVGTVKLNSDNKWTATVENLPKYDSTGAEITYTVEEKEYQNDEYYTPAVTGDKSAGYTITNTMDWNKVMTTIPVEKVWNDDNNAVGKRSLSIDVIVKGSDGSQQTVTLNEANNWKADVEVHKYDAQGNEITYTVEEVTKNDFYTTRVDGYKVINDIMQDKVQTSVSVTKVWNDGDNKENKRPGEIEVAIKNGTEEVTTATLTAGNGWTATVENLPKYDSTGTEITYTVEEKEYENDDYYTSSVAGSQAAGYTITNTIDWEKFETSVPVEKKWEGDTEKVRPTNIKVVVKNGTEPVGETILNKDSDWKHTFNGLPKYTADGTEITYTVEEIAVQKGQLDNYETTVNGYTITNRYLSPDLSITKSSTTNETVVKENGKESYINYTITVSNNGEGTAKDVVVKDTLPTGTSYVSSSEKLADSADSSIGKLVWEIASIAPGAHKEITVRTKVTDNVTFGQTVTNTASIEGEEEPSNPVEHQIEGKVTVKEDAKTISATNIVLVIDVSDSMDKSAGNNTTRIEAAKNAAISFIQKAYPDRNQKVVVPIKVVLFADSASELKTSGWNPTSITATDYDSAQTLINRIRYYNISNDDNGTGTDMKEALVQTQTTINSLKAKYPDNENTVIFLGDGEPTHPESYPSYPYFDDNYEYAIEQKAKEIRNSGVTIYSIGFGIDELSNKSSYVYCPYTNSGCPHEHVTERTWGGTRKTDYHEISPREEAKRTLQNISSGDGYYFLSNNADDLLKTFDMIFDKESKPFTHTVTTVDGIATVTLTRQLDTSKPIVVSVNGRTTEYTVNSLPRGLRYNNGTFTWDVTQYAIDTELSITCSVKE